MIKELWNQYPKALATLVIGLAVTYLTGKISAEYLKPEIVTTAIIVLTGAFSIVFGRYIRFPKTDVELLDEKKAELTEKDESE